MRITSGVRVMKYAGAGLYTRIDDREGHTPKGIGMLVADFVTGNHLKDDLSPLKTIRRFLGVVRSTSRSSSKGRPSSRFSVFVGLYTHSFTHSNLMIPLPKFISYDEEPNVELLRGFFNLGHVDLILYLTELKASWEHSSREPIIYYRGKGIYSSYFVCYSNLSAHNFAKNTADSKDSPLEKDNVMLIDISIADTLKNQKTYKACPLCIIYLCLRTEGLCGLPMVVSHVTPPFWKHHLKEVSMEKLYDMHDKAYMRQVVLDNVMNRRTREVMSTLSEARTACDTIKERERRKDKEYAKMEAKCNDALKDLEKNPLVLDLRAEVATLQEQVERLHGEYSRLVLEEKKWVNYEQTFSSFCSKVEGLEAENKRLDESDVQLLQQINELK
nr:hypothetical protein [Tanacetum cinerariifolium]